jgi:hypothetical protein
MGIRAGQVRLRRLAGQLAEDKEIGSEDLKFLVDALLEIADGSDAEIALGVKAKKGERKGKHAAKTKMNRNAAMGWIAVAIESEKEGGLGLTVKDAAVELNKEWENLYSVETLCRYWSDAKNTQAIYFSIETE